MIFGGYVKVPKSLHAWDVIAVNTVLNHIDIGVVLPRYEGSYMVYRPEWYGKRNIVKYTYRRGIKNCDILVIDTWMVRKEKENNIIAIFVYYDRVLDSQCYVFGETIFLAQKYTSEPSDLQSLE